jgi:D-alanine-D-alanine ligase
MKVGMTYDLRADYKAEGYAEEDIAEFDTADTIDSIESELRNLGHETDRIGNFKSLVGRLAGGGRWDVVFNIAEGVSGYGRESLVPSLLEAYGIPYTFSDPLALSITLHKGMAKRVVRDTGIPTADFAVVESISGVKDVTLAYPLFVKPVAEGTGKGVTESSLVRDLAALKTECSRLLYEYKQPVLVETYLPGREFTVGITGTGKGAVALTPMEVILKKGADSGAYTYRNKEECEELVTYRLAADNEAMRAANVALAAYRALGLRDAGRVDLRSDRLGNPRFIEVNPLAGLNPHHSDLPIMCTLAGISYFDLMGRIMKSAIDRVPEKIRELAS